LCDISFNITGAETKLMLGGRIRGFSAIPRRYCAKNRIMISKATFQIVFTALDAVQTYRGEI